MVCGISIGQGQILWKKNDTLLCMLTQEHGFVHSVSFPTHMIISPH